MQICKVAIFSVFLILINSTPSLSKSLNIKCSNIKGATIDYKDGDVKIGKDGFSGQSISFKLDRKKIKTFDRIEVQWKGRNNFKWVSVVTNVNSREGVVFFAEVSDAREIGRSYAFFLERMALTFAEQQTNLASGLPQIRALTASCSAN